jgi:hypothetical protein
LLILGINSPVSRLCALIWTGLLIRAINLGTYFG